MSQNFEVVIYDVRNDSGDYLAEITMAVAPQINWQLNFTDKDGYRRHGRILEVVFNHNVQDPCDFDIVVKVDPI